MKLEPKVGMTVLLLRGKGTEPSPAIICKVGVSGTLDLAVFHTAYASVIPYDGVPHVDSDQAQRSFDEDIGVWDFTDFDKQLLEALGEESAPIKRGPGRPRKEEAVA